MKQRHIVLAMVLLFATGGVAWAAQAGLGEAHQQAVAIYKKDKDASRAVRILEDAGITNALHKKPADMKKAAYVSLLNDYGFFLAEAADTSVSRGLAIDALEKVIELSPDRAAAYLNLGDVYVKEIEANSDTGAKQEFRELALKQYQRYAQLLRAKKRSTKMPDRVRLFLERAADRNDPAYRYKLVMNKEKETGSDVCTHMLDLLSADWARFRTIRFDLHQEFTSIPWIPMNNLGPELQAKSGEISIAKFDINNDGKDDLVVKSQWSFRGKLSEELDVYRDEENALPLKSDFGVADLKQSQGSIGRGGVYPSIKRSDKSPSLGARLLVYPFKYKDHVYISIKDRADEFEFETYEEDIKMEKWHVVARYKGGEETEDLCYFLLESEPSKKKEIKIGERR